MTSLILFFISAFLLSQDSSNIRVDTLTVKTDDVVGKIDINNSTNIDTTNITVNSFFKELSTVSYFSEEVLKYPSLKKEKNK